MNGTIPQVNIWDDHDIIDGFGSYVDEFMKCDVTRRATGGLFNQFDGSIDLLDDLDDHYTARTHKRERQALVERLQKIAAEFSVRITILGGDVHLAALGRFYSHPKLGIATDNDHRYMANVILLEAGLPKNVIQFVPGDPVEVTKVALAHQKFAALHYTGSTAVFRKLYGEIGAGVAEGRYQSYPRIVGETGGKNFHLLHPSADVDNAALQTVRGAFEYQGQKCSATSRAYVPKSLWPQFKARVVSEVEKLKQGDPTEHTNFLGPVIHEASFKKLSGVIDAAKNDSELELLVGGTHDKSKGFFVQPTVYATTNKAHKLMSTELFGPVLVVHVYDDSVNATQAFSETCDLVDSTGEYGLTGSVFASDREAIRFAEEKLRNSAGNFYINCKSTGAVVGQQPFGGSRASGTNDKAGSAALMGRFVNMRSIKEEFVATTQVEYPSNEA
ncbi:hypothetical protein BN1708_008788, partial [Verticillium longisporum]